MREDRRLRTIAWRRRNPKRYKELNRDYYWRYRDENRKLAAAWRKAHPGWMRYFHLKNNYGLTREVYDGMVRKQGGRCAICRRKPSGKGKNGVLHVDHCHKTEKVRALLCSPCNAGIGSLGDDPKRVALALRYLKRFC